MSRIHSPLHQEVQEDTEASQSKDSASDISNTQGGPFAFNKGTENARKTLFFPFHPPGSCEDGKYTAKLLSFRRAGKQRKASLGLHYSWSRLSMYLCGISCGSAKRMILHTEQQGSPESEVGR